MRCVGTPQRPLSRRPVRSYVLRLDVSALRPCSPRLPNDVCAAVCRRAASTARGRGFLISFDRALRQSTASHERRSGS